jgi:hypothetical protein
VTAVTAWVHCPVCDRLRFMRRVVDSDGTCYWVCRVCWTHLPEEVAR